MLIFALGVGGALIGFSCAMYEANDAKAYGSISVRKGLVERVGIVKPLQELFHAFDWTFSLKARVDDAHETFSAQARLFHEIALALLVGAFFVARDQSEFSDFLSLFGAVKYGTDPAHRVCWQYFVFDEISSAKGA